MDPSRQPWVHHIVGWGQEPARVREAKVVARQALKTAHEGASNDLVH